MHIVSLLRVNITEYCAPMKLSLPDSYPTPACLHYHVTMLLSALPLGQWKVLNGGEGKCKHGVQMCQRHRG